MRQSNKVNTIKTTKPVATTLAGTVKPFAGDTSGWPTINGVRQKNGWAVCEGDVLEQADYEELFAALGSTWNSFNHPNDGTPTVGGSQFALPNFQGLFLGGAGDNGDSNFTLGTYADDLTAKNGLATLDDTHNHSITDPGHVHGTKERSSGSGSIAALLDSSASSFQVTGSNTTGITINNDTHNHVITGDAETRPKTAPVVYIIALYDNVAAGALGLPEATATEAGTVERETAEGTLTTDATGYTEDSTNCKWYGERIGNLVTLKIKLKFDWSSPSDTTPDFNLNSLPSSMELPAGAIFIVSRNDGSFESGIFAMKGGAITVYRSSVFGGFAGSGTFYTGHPTWGYYITIQYTTGLPV